MSADLEQLVLSGALFNGQSRSSSPARSASPDHDWPNSENGSDLDYDSDAERNKEIEKTLSAARGGQPAQQSIGMGPGRTGVKGVIRDRAEAQTIERERRAREVEELNRRMEKASLGGKTFLEEERERDLEKMMLEGLDPLTFAQGQEKDGAGRKGSGKFGHLREVGAKGFVAAVEQEASNVWVVVHIYDPSLERCYDLDSTLSSLARFNPQTKFLRTRASALGFASISSNKPQTAWRPQRRSLQTAEDEDEEEEVDIFDGDGEYEDGEDAVDLDVLPTLLVYRAGELVHNWVRVDWEAGRQGVDGLLSKNQVLQNAASGLGNCGLPSDDEDDPFDSDIEG